MYNLIQVLKETEEIRAMTNPEITGLNTLDCPDCGLEVHWAALGNDNTVVFHYSLFYFRNYRIDQCEESPF